MRSSVDLFQHVSMQMKVLDFFGLSFRIPYSKKSVYFWLGVLSRVCLGVFVFIIPTAGQIVYLIRLMLSGKAEIQEIVSISNLVLTEMLASFKLLDMRLRRDMLQLLFDQFTSKEFHYTSKPLQAILTRAVMISRRLFLGTLLSCSFDVLVHTVVVPGLNRFETLPLKMDLIFVDVKNPKYFSLICAYQILYKPCMVASFAVIQSLPWALMAFTVSQLDVLIYNFENMKELVKATRNERRCDENEAFQQIFKECVRHYSAIKRFTNNLQAVFSVQISSSMFLIAIIIGTTAMQFMSIESPQKNFTEVLWVLAYLMIFVAMLFVDCYFGNSVTVKCANLSNIVFACPWINLRTGLKKDLVLFLAQIQQPVVITASKFIPVSLNTFTKVMNWTYNGFAVLNHMK